MKYTGLILAALLGITSCEAPGRRAAQVSVIDPSAVTDFRQLYNQNCSGCHGKDSQGALTVGIGTPVYLAIADDATIRRIAEEGRPGTAMPAFAQKAGGTLTDAQIDILIRGIRARSRKLGAFGSDQPPAYAASRPGDPEHGQNVFQASCSSCHSFEDRVGSILDSSYLSLVSDQYLRTVTIVGMPALGMPDWRNYNEPLSDADVTDVVAWLVSQREPLSARSNRRE